MRYFKFYRYILRWKIIIIARQKFAIFIISWNYKITKQIEISFAIWRSSQHFQRDRKKFTNIFENEKENLYLLKWDVEL